MASVFVTQLLSSVIPMKPLSPFPSTHTHTDTPITNSFTHRLLLINSVACRNTEEPNMCHLDRDQLLCRMTPVLRLDTTCRRMASQQDRTLCSNDGPTQKCNDFMEHLHQSCSVTSDFLLENLRLVL